MMFNRSLLLPVGLTTLLLSIDAAVSIGLVSSMVAFLHGSARDPIVIGPPGGSPLRLAGLPENLATDPGHLANAAGGTALVLVGAGGALALWLERQTRRKWDKSSPALYIWAIVVLLSWLLTLAALVYAFVETSLTSGQAIDLGVARANPPPTEYPRDRWTPETWEAAVLELPLANPLQRRLLEGKLTGMRAWRWNLVALFVLGFVLLVLVALELWRLRRRNRQSVSMVEVLSPPAKK